MKVAIVDYGVGNLFSLKSSLEMVSANLEANRSAKSDQPDSAQQVHGTQQASCTQQAGSAQQVHGTQQAGCTQHAHGSLNDAASSGLQIETVVTGDPAVLRLADKIILPGVGAFGDAAKKLRENDLDQVVIEQAHNGKPLLGICLGMQLLFDQGEEYGLHKGLGLIPGRVVPMKGVIPDDYKIPHIGWNGLRFPKDKPKSPLFRYIEEGDCVYFVHSYFATDCQDALIADTEYGADLTAAVAKDNIYGCQFHPEKSGNVGLSILRAFCEL